LKESPLRKNGIEKAIKTTGRLTAHFPIQKARTRCTGGKWKREKTKVSGSKRNPGPPWADLKSPITASLALRFPRGNEKEQIRREAKQLGTLREKVNQE